MSLPFSDVQFVFSELDPKVNAAITRLQTLIPLLKEFQPEGWRDFRDGVPPDIRFGLFTKAKQPDGILEMKMIFGSVAAARLAQFQFTAATQLGALLEPPSESPYGVKGMWQLFLTIPEAEICW